MQHFNFIDASCLYALHGNTRFRNVAIRYVGEGMESYTLGGAHYDVGPRRYLVGNHYAGGKIDIESTTPVWGICIDLDPGMVAQVVASHLRPDTPQPDVALDTVFQGPDFPVYLRHAGDTPLGRLLRQLEARAKTGPFGHALFPETFYLQTAALLVQETGEVLRQMMDIRSLKQPTRIDLHRKVTLGKLYLDEHFTGSFQIAGVAKAAGMSEYHFFRLFKAVYHLSPYQYVLKKRIELAKTYIRQGNSTLSGIALQTGFADLFSFSKAFKKHTGIAPSQFGRNSGAIE